MNAESYNLTPEQEARLDHFVDTRGGSYDDAYRELEIVKPRYVLGTAVEIDPVRDGAANDALGQAHVVANEITEKAISKVATEDPQTAALIRAKAEKREREREIVRRQKGL